ncbi:MAG TPA: flagellar export protein FliJ [Clostridiaceae bacterium]|nr:flagellar export protein FliJ [Clostridiaceae bacterium]HHV99041.1 flagellar export protein FliJ [Clostridiaceae bacterium]
MAKFNFKLQSVLDLKIQMEDNKKNEFGSAVQKLEYEKKVLENIKDEKEKNINAFGNELKNKAKVSTLRQINSYISLLGQKIEVQKENVNKASNIVDKKREELLEAVKERKIMDKLKEKEYNLFLKQELKEEQKIIDEIISFKHSTN